MSRNKTSTNNQTQIADPYPIWRIPMTHKGGKKGRAAFKRAKNVPAKLKERVEDLSQLQLSALLRFIEVLLKSSQHKTGHSRSKSSSHTKKKGSHRKLSPGIHSVRIAKQGMRKVRVLANGK